MRCQIALWGGREEVNDTKKEPFSEETMQDQDRDQDQGVRDNGTCHATIEMCKNANNNNDDDNDNDKKKNPPKWNLIPQKDRAHKSATFINDQQQRQQQQQQQQQHQRQRIKLCVAMKTTREPPNNVVEYL